MRIIRADHLGMCFGVRDAIATAEESVQQTPVTVLGQLVHNKTVLNRLTRQGIAFAEQAAEVATKHAIITAHGSSEAARRRASDAGLQLIDTTCPLVSHAHRAVHRLVSQGFHPVVIGKRGHVEVTGLTEDLAECDIVLCEEDIERLKPKTRFGVCAQTTQPIDRVKRLVAYMKTRFPRAVVQFLDTVCQPTKQRQTAAIRLAREADVVIVVGGSNSNNTRELGETCRTHCRRVHQVEFADDLRPEWFQADDLVGLTAGTSTPDETINRVEVAISKLDLANHFATQSETDAQKPEVTESILTNH